MTRLAVLMACLLASACQSTSFQLPPIAAEPGCDPALQGRWTSVNDEGRPTNDMQLAIGADCRLAVTDRDKGQRREGESTTLRWARAGGRTYAWVTAGWADLRFDARDLGTNPDDIYLFRYRAEGNRLDVEFVDHKAVAHHIIDGRITGAVRSDEHALVNRVTGPARPEVLDVPGLFAAEPAHFRRQEASP